MKLHPLSRHLPAIAALLLMLGVAAGAFGAHALRAHVDAAMLATWQTAVLYQLIHGLGLLLVCALHNRLHPVWAQRGTRLLLAGTLMFSGSLYLLVLGGPVWAGIITPIGGSCFLLGWALVAVASWRHDPSEPVPSSIRSHA